MELFGSKKNGKHSGKSSRTGGGVPPLAEDYQSGAGTQYGRQPGGAPEDYTDEQVRRGTHRWLRRGLIGLAVAVMIAGAAYAGLQLWTKPPDTGADGPVVQSPQGSDAVEPTAAPSPTETPVDAEAPESGGTGRKDGAYTFAVIGKDVVGDHTDTILVGTFFTEENKLNIVSIPRDTLVNTPYDYKKINIIYPACVNNGKDGLQPLLDTLEDMLGYGVDSYALVDINACAQLVDTIGGVWFDVPVDMDWDAPDQDLYIHIKAGYQKLSGEDAVKVMRFRYSNDGSNSYKGGDIDRIQVQHDLLMAMAKQMLTLGNIPNIGKLIQIYEDNVTTNVTASNLSFYAQEFLKLDSEDIHFDTLPANYWGSLYGVGYCLPYIDDWLQMVNTYLNPFNTEITRSNIDMLYSDGVDVYGTQGYISGGIQSFENYTP